MMVPEKIKEECRHKMEASLSVLHKETVGIRTGRASTALLESVKVDYYGSPTPISQMATIAAPEPQMITIQPWDISQIPIIEKAVMASDIGITPVNDGKMIRLVIPPMTEERRKELAKLVKKMGEENKVAMRNVRREGMERVKKLLKEKELSEDEEKKLEKEIQGITDEYIGKIDAVITAKEKEIMET